MVKPLALEQMATCYPNEAKSHVVCFENGGKLQHQSAMQAMSPTLPQAWHTKSST